MESVLADALIGRVLDGRYHVRSRIAHGGMATVYLATDTRLDRQVALKVMHAELARDADFVGRFIGEAKSVARLSHPNIVAVFDQGSDGQYLYLAMEYVPGRTLRSLLRDRGWFPWDNALEVMDPILAGLAAAHHAGIVHRDVKPENVLLAADGRVKVVDFGLARAQAAAGNTRAGLIIGTVAYIAPEQVTGGVTDFRTDVYAAGVMLFELLTGRQPHTGESPLAVAYKHVNSDVPPPGNFVAGVPAAVDQLVWSATSRDPQRRPADAGEFLRAVRALRGAGGGTGASPGATGIAAGVTGEFGAPGAEFDRPGAGRPRLDGPGSGSAAAFGGAAGFGGAAAFDGAAGGSHTMVVSDGGGYDRGGGRHDTGRYDAGGEPTYHGHEPFLQRWLFSRRLAYVAAAAVAMIGLGFGGWYVTSGRYTPLPSVDGMTLTAAEQALHQAGFGVRVGTPTIDNNVPKGDVVTTSPTGRAVKGATIVLTVSSGPKMIVIPPVTGKSLADALSALRAAGLTVNDTPNKVGVDGAAVNSVAGTTPAAGTSWPANRAVTVNVVAGMALPNLVGQDFNTVQNNWANPNHIQLSQQQVASNQPQGIIVRQSPAPNTPVTQGETVTVYVSSGPPQVAIPDLRGQHFGQAQQELQQLGFQVNGKQFGPGDTVFLVNPTGSAPSGSTITVWYGGF